MADAMLTYRLNQSTTANFALINSGGVRASIDVGPITRGEVLTAFPFGNAIVEIAISGDELWKTLEGVYSKVSQFNGKPLTSIIQVSRGINITYNSDAANGTKLVSVLIGNKQLDKAKTYNVVTLDFLAGGGDNIFQKKSSSEYTILDTQDEVLTAYIQAQSPVNVSLEGRILNANGTVSILPIGPTSTGSSVSGTSSVLPTQTRSWARKNAGERSLAAVVGVGMLAAVVGSLL
jgi:2',3'-cyclic-nucleotide 2'-phosphodiesterase (5'-nucleotidase family)